MRRQRINKDLLHSEIVWTEFRNHWFLDYNPWSAGHGYLDAEFQAVILTDDFESYECYY